jgi:anti-sigma28 factor (negative regulator of flagellin synthesis)
MRITAVTQSLQSELRKVESAKKADKAASSSKVIPADRSDISADARLLSSTKASADIIAASISSQADIRTDKISEVQEKIRNGYYNSPEFIDKLAVKLLAEFGIKAPPL